MLISLSQFVIYDLLYMHLFSGEML